MPTLLAVDDEPAILTCFRSLFRAPEVRLETALSVAEGLEKFGQVQPDVVLLDMDLPDQSGLDAFRRLQQLDVKVPVIFLTGSGSTETTIEAMRLGAYEYLHKPFKINELRELVFRAFAVSRLMKVPALFPRDAAALAPADSLIGRSPGMQEVYKAIGRAAPSDVTVLILGESGTGKELVARAIYHYSRRSDGPFFAMNCAALPEALLESELFGHEKGAFTGAVQRRIGKFEQYSGGTLFLDEVGDMTPATQAKLLRVIQDQRFERVGGNETLQTNVRLIAATNRDLEQAVAARSFRTDLYYRLKGYTIALPPLRHRDDDLPLLVEYMLRRFSRELGKEVYQVAPETLVLMGQYSWPGNVRELQSVVKHAVLQATGPAILPEFLPANFQQPRPEIAAVNASSPAQEWEQFLARRVENGTQDLYSEWQALTDRLAFQHVLRHTKGNLSQAARILGINRATLRTKLEALGIDAEVANS